MKKYIVFSLSLLMFCSCLKDHTREGNLQISEISIDTTTIKRFYEKEQWDTLVISPGVSEIGTHKDLSYEWQIDYKIVSTEPVLRYICKGLITTRCRLKVSNEDGAAFYHFNIKVNSLYEEGVFILSKYNESSMLTFKRTDIDRPAYIGVYAQYNPDFPLGKTPKFVAAVSYLSSFGYHPFQREDGKRNVLFIGTHDPQKVYIVDGSTLKTYREIIFPQGAIVETAKIRLNLHPVPTIFMGGGKAYEYNDNNVQYVPYAITDGNPWEVKVSLLPKDAYLSNDVVLTYYTQYNIKGIPWYAELNEIIWFDERFDRLLAVSLWDNSSSYELIPGELTGMNMVRALPCDGMTNALFLMKREGTGVLRLIYYGRYNIYNNVDVSGTTLNENSAMAASQFDFDPILYYSNGNGIYRFYYYGANVPSTPFLTVAPGSEIKSMVILDPGLNDVGDIYKILYVGVWNPASSSEYKGSLYCFDLNSNELLWKEENIAGDIVDMKYQYKYIRQ